MNSKENTQLLPNKLIPQTRWLFVIVMLVACVGYWYRFDHRYSFAWDQERDATIIWQKIIQHHDLTLLGPRVINDNGFYLGPLHYYLHVPFFAALQGNPIAGAVATSVYSLFGIAGIFWMLTKIADKQYAFFMSLLLALLPLTHTWNVSYLPIFTIAVIYCATEALRTKQVKFVLWGTFLASLSLQSHATGLFLFLPLIYTAIVSGISWSLRSIVLICVACLAPFLPLIVFDLLHKGLNVHLFLHYITHSQTTIADVSTGFLVMLRSLQYFAPYLPMWLLYSSLSLMIAVFSWGIFFSRSSYKRLLILLSTIVYGEIIAFSVFRGQTSEYYFIPLIMSLLLGTLVSISAMKMSVRISILCVMIFLASYNFIQALTSDDGDLYKKMSVVSMAKTTPHHALYIHADSYGLDSGIPYIISYYNIQNDPSSQDELYILVMDDYGKYDAQKFYKQEGRFALSRPQN